MIQRPPVYDYVHKASIPNTLILNGKLEKRVTLLRLLDAELCHPYDYLKSFISNLAMVEKSHSG